MGKAGAFIIPRKKSYEGNLVNMLSSMNGVDVQDVSDKGIMVTLKFNDILMLSDLADVISKSYDVFDFQITGLDI